MTNDKRGMEKLYRLFRLQCQDLLVLCVMEYNGMLYDTKGALEKAANLQETSDELVREFHNCVGTDCVNIASGDDISSVLYGGVVEEVFRVAIGHFKSGERKGEIRYKNEILSHTFTQLVPPIKNTETAKNISGKKATYSVAEDILKKLKAKSETKKLIDIILEYRGIEKLRSTYLQGWADLIESECWEPNMIHHSLNQCTAVTGRLSSSKPTGQNASKAIKVFLRTRY